MTLLLSSPAMPAFLQGGGEMGARIRATDWGATPLGEVRDWPLPLRSAIAICLHSSFPTAIYWGAELRLLYNDAWSDIPADRHPWALGRPGAEVWSDIWPVVGPQFEHVLRHGEGVSAFEQALPMLRGGRVEETWWNYSLTPILDESGRVAGVFNQGNEITARVLAERRLAFRLALEDRLRDQRDPASIRDTVAQALRQHLRVAWAGVAAVAPDGSARDPASAWRCPPGGTATLAGGEALAIGDTRLDLGAAGLDLPPALLALPILRGGRLVAVLHAGHTAPRRWTAADIVLLREVADRVWSALGRAEAEAALAESEARFRTLADSAPALVWTADADGLRSWVSAGWRALTGQSEGEALGLGWTAPVHAEDRDLVEAGWLAAARGREAFRMEYRLRAADGGLRWVLDTAAPRPDGAPGFIGSTLDITERRRMEERHALLAREVDHRAKNTLAVVLAALRMTRAHGLDEYRTALEGRVATLARAQALMDQGCDGGVDIRTLVEGALDPFLVGGDPATGLRLRMEGPAAAMPAGSTQPLAMALHELATNAVKHGALSAPEGEVSVRWEVEQGPGVGARTMVLRWQERGGPPVRHPPDRRGFGTRVLDGTVRAQLGGSVAMDWQAAGLSCLMAIPLAQAALVEAPSRA